MSRLLPVNFNMVYHIDFECAIRGHHVYKSCWAPSVGEKLKCKKEDRKEALDYDSHALGVYKGNLLIGHVPIEISALTDYFLKESEENYVDVTVTGKRKREVGLVVPARYTAVTTDKRTANILFEQFKKKHEKYSHFELKIVTESIVKRPLYL